MKLTGAEILCESLTRLGVREIFGYPGGAILPVYDALGKSKLHHILVRHEQGATHMADGYARGALFVADQNVMQLGLAKRVVHRKNRAAGVSEDMPHTEARQRFAKNFRTRELH